MTTNNDAENRRVRPRPSPARAGGRLVGQSGLLRLVLAVLLAVSVVTGAEKTRRLRSGEPPEYPALAKKLNIRGVARVELTVAPDGSVKEVKELGGNPLLLDALNTAVKRWKYEASDSTSVVEVRFVFPAE